MVVIGEDLFGAGNITRRTFQVDGIGSQVDIDIQAVFQQAQIFVSRAEESFDVGADFNALLHLVGYWFLTRSFPGFGCSKACAGSGVCIIQADSPDARAQSSLLRDKPFLCLEVEPAEGARPEVQATTITVKGTPARGRESMAFKTVKNRR